LDAPAHREYTQSELAEKAGVSRKPVHRHLDLLLEVGNRGHPRYQFNPESEVAEQLIKLDGALNRAGPHAPGSESESA
jgi:DNA-binding XRE family transcriptional regulator